MSEGSLQRAFLPSDPRAQIVELLKRRGSMSIDALVEELGLSKTATRGHLSSLEERGLIERVSARSPGRGRPPLVVQLSDLGERGLFPHHDGELLQQLLLFIEREGQEALLASFFEELWARRLEEFEGLCRLRSARGVGARLEVLREYLERHDFMPQLVWGSSGAEDGEPGEGEVEIRECNCPFPAAVEITRLPCQLEARFMEAALGRAPSQVGYMPDGELACRYRFEGLEQSKE